MIWKRNSEATANSPRGAATVLLWHFFRFFFHNERLTGEAEIRLTLQGVLTLVAIPGSLSAISAIAKAGYLYHHPSVAWAPANYGDKLFYLTFTYALMGFLILFEFESLFPDLEDYLVLGAQPVKPGILFLAKTAALFLFLGPFSVRLIWFPVWPTRFSLALFMGQSMCFECWEHMLLLY